MTLKLRHREKDRRVQLYCAPEGEEGYDGKTKQEHANDADIKTLYKRAITQNIPMPERRSIGQYLDLTNVPDYQTALNKVIEADNAFAQLPSSLRDKLQNNPKKFLDFVQTPQGQKELIALGLATPLPADPDPVPEARSAPNKKSKKEPTEPEGEA